MAYLILIGSFIAQIIFAGGLVLYDEYYRKDRDTAGAVVLAFIAIQILMRYRYFEILGIAIFIFTILILKSKVSMASKALYSVFLLASGSIVIIELAPQLVPRSIVSWTSLLMVMSVVFIPIMGTLSFRKYWILRKTDDLWFPQGFFSRNEGGIDSDDS